MLVKRSLVVLALSASLALGCSLSPRPRSTQEPQSVQDQECLLPCAEEVETDALEDIEIIGGVLNPSFAFKGKSIGHNELRGMVLFIDDEEATRLLKEGERSMRTARLVGYFSATLLGQQFGAICAGRGGDPTLSVIGFSLLFADLAFWAKGQSKIIGSVKRYNQVVVAKPKREESAQPAPTAEKPEGEETVQPTGSFLALIKTPLGESLDGAPLFLSIDGQEIRVGQGGLTDLNGLLVGGLSPGRRRFSLRFAGRQEAVDLDLRNGQVLTLTFRLTRIAFWGSLHIAYEERYDPLVDWIRKHGNLEIKRISWPHR